MKKKVISLIAASLIIGVAILSVISCSKTEQERIDQQGKITHFSPSQEMVEPTIKTFIQRFEDYKAGYKTGGEDIKLGEAIWTLEAGVNYEYQSPKEELGDFTVDSISFTFNVSVGEDSEYYIAEADAMELYDEMLSFTGNQVSAEDVELLLTDLNAVSVENGQVVFKTIAISGKGGSDPCSINSTDYWYPVADQGKCGAYIGQQIGKDATDIIDRIINCSQVEVDYWTDIDVFEFLYNGFTPCAEENCFWEGAYNDCLSPSEMTYWSNQSLNLIDELKPTGKYRISADVDWDYSGFPNTIYLHFMRYLSYGVPHTSGGGTK